MARLEENQTSMASRISAHDHAIDTVRRDVADSRQESQRSSGSAALEARDAASAARAAASKADAVKGALEELTDSLMVDTPAGKKVPLREVVVAEISSLRRLQAQAWVILALVSLAWPFAVDAIRRWLFP
jgi:hypothetical protein